MLKETIRRNDFNEAKGRADVIATIRNIQNKDEVFAVLTKSNKMLNEKGVKISASGGDIVLNGVKVDFSEFTAMNKKQATEFLSNIPKMEPTALDIASSESMASNILKSLADTDINSIANITVKLVNFCTSDIKAKIISALAELLSNLTVSIIEVLETIFPIRKYIYLTEMVISFFARAAENLEKQYDMWIETKDLKYYNSIFEFIDIKKVTKYISFFEKAVNLCCNNGHLTRVAYEKLLTYFHTWLAQKICEYQQDKETEKERKEHSASALKIKCLQCSGYHYKQKT